MADQSGLTPLGQWLCWCGLLAMTLAFGYVAGWTDGRVHEQKNALHHGAAHYYLDSHNERRFEYLEGNPK